MDDAIPGWFDLVVWGHGHQCIPSLVVAASGVKILQPGSTVRTSLIQSEEHTKHCFTLTVETDLNGQPQLKQLEAVPLRSVRPFKYREIIMKNTNILQDDQT
jgi:2',3'-cyclic-nucleotide 2'-phosphodiesterase (5'-nucleotidase family)